MDIGACTGASLSHAGSSMTTLQPRSWLRAAGDSMSDSELHQCGAVQSCVYIYTMWHPADRLMPHLRGRMTSSCTRNTGKKLMRAHSQAQAVALACHPCGCAAFVMAVWSQQQAQVHPQNREVPMSAPYIWMTNRFELSDSCIAGSLTGDALFHDTQICSTRRRKPRQLLLLGVNEQAEMRCLNHTCEHWINVNVEC